MGVIVFLKKFMEYPRIVLYLLPVLNPKSYDGARVLEASGRPIGIPPLKYVIVSITCDLCSVVFTLSHLLVYRTSI